MKRIDKSQVNMSGLNKLNRVLIGKSPVHYERTRVFWTPASLEKELSAIQSKNFSKYEESDSEVSLEEALERPPSSEEVTLILVIQ